MTPSSLLIRRRAHPLMTMGKMLLALAVGFALAACSNSQQPADNATGNDPAAAATQAAADTVASVATGTAVSDAAGTVTNGDVTTDAAEQAQGSGEAAAASADTKSNNVPALPVGTSQTAVAAKGKALYETTCIACHGAKGQGAIPGVPDLAKGGRLAKPDAELVANILNGFQSKGSPMAMPPKGGNPNLTAADAQALLVHMRILTASSK